MRRALLTAALASLALAATAPAAMATFLPGPNGKIAFTSSRVGGDNEARIWVADYPGGTPQQVTTLPARQHRHPSWSPDHSKIVYAAGRAFTGPFALWVVDLRTGAQTEFVPEADRQDRPSWSPDGTRIAYAARGDLWVKGVEPGATPVQLTVDGDVAVEERPVWSPDGATLYYNRGVAGNRDIYKLSPVTPAGTHTPVLADANDDWQPALSPDGRRLCFLRGPQSDLADLWTVNVDGSGAAVYSATAARGDLNCVWSPDGTRILYTLGAFGAGELATKDLAGGSFDPLASMNVNAVFDGNADWATNFSPACAARNTAIAVNAFTTIALSCTDPDQSAGAAPPIAAPLDATAIEILAQPAHGNLGGLSDDGHVVYTPQANFSGTDTFTYRGSDGTSDAPPATVTIAVGVAAGDDVRPPTISRVTVSPRRFRRGTALPRIARAAVGTTISYRLDEAARVTLSFKRATPGRRVGGRCVKVTRRNAARGRCTRFVASGALAGLAGRNGANAVRFQGRLSRSRTLKLGTYRVVVAARDAAGNRSQRSGPTFTIVAR